MNKPNGPRSDRIVCDEVELDGAKVVAEQRDVIIRREDGSTFSIAGPTHLDFSHLLDLGDVIAADVRS